MFTLNIGKNEISITYKGESVGRLKTSCAFFRVNISLKRDLTEVGMEVEDNLGDISRRLDVLDDINYCFGEVPRLEFTLSRVSFTLYIPVCTFLSQLSLGELVKCLCVESRVLRVLVRKECLLRKRVSEVYRSLIRLGGASSAEKAIVFC